MINTSAKSSEKLATIVKKSSRSVLEMGAKIGSAVVSINNKAAVGVNPDIILFPFI